jgi:putative ABC transport system substrate-binding protein
MKRRQFVAVIGSAAVASIASPLPLPAQQAPPLKRIGFIIGQAEDADTQPRLTVFRQGLAALGWIEGRNVEIVSRFGTIDPDRTRNTVAELLRLAPDVIVTSNAAWVIAFLNESRTIPIVYTFGNDPVALGFSESLSHPGGNVTGFTTGEAAMATKWLQLLRELAPNVIRVAILMAPAAQYPSGNTYVRALEAAAPLLMIEFTTTSLRDAREIEQAIDSFASQPNGGLIVLPSGGVFGDSRELIAKLAARHRLPAIYPFRYFAVAGGLMSYGPDVVDLFRRAAAYVDRILRGAKPADLPFQEPTKFKLVINLKTAKALGITIPETLLATADEVIQ